MQMQIQKTIEMLETEIAMTDSTTRKLIESNQIKKATLKELYNTHYSLNLSSIDIDLKIQNKEHLIDINNYNKNIASIEKIIKKDILNINLKIKQIEEEFIKKQNNNSQEEKKVEEKKLEEKKVEKKVEEKKVEEKKVEKKVEEKKVEEKKVEEKKEEKKVEKKVEEKKEEEKKVEEKKVEEKKKKEEKLKKDIEKAKLKKEKELKENNTNIENNHTTTNENDDGEGCIFIFDKGTKTGQRCCRVTKFGRYCGYHKKYNNC